MNEKKIIKYCHSYFKTEDEFKKSAYYTYFQMLEYKYSFVYDSRHPDFIFANEYGTKHLDYPKAIRVQWTFENVPPDFFEFDYIIGTANLKYGKRYFHYPIYAYTGYRYLLQGLNERPKMTQDELNNKKYFCNFVYSNRNCSSRRTDWFKEISKYKFVHAPGALCHNTDPIPMGDDWTDTFEKKTAYQREFKFSMAFENASAPGYTSEKIFNAFRARTIPIYWGDPDIENIINEDSFVNLNKYSSYKEALDRIVEIDTNDELYLNMINTPPLKNNNFTNFELIDNETLRQLDLIFSDEFGNRNTDCKLWDYRYEMRYRYGAKVYEFYMSAFQNMYELYKKIKR